MNASGAGHRILSIVWSAGCLLVGLIALSAIVGCARVIVDMWGGTPDRAGRVWAGFAGAAVAAGAGGLTVVVVLARRGHEALAASIGIAGIVVTRAIAIASIPTPLTTDWGDYHDLAVILSTGGTSTRPDPPAGRSC